ncbi:TetR/AcrR family transcriptional regulator [Marinococcus sp. PL1-022]|uniref:TetR/AcrR family transcriptional regulator n=1 Tax=Marinococcus sp. PL1-022 TaxID=3095363 RepID=UPI0029C2C567|nr:TetR/AcrR family transcriptional regulator [Marinococcus sp. PL1-022]MDX6154538.1 TetR/AcrR family transcriptional regulator [Marinococcus sp. PL1-022]
MNGFERRKQRMQETIKRTVLELLQHTDPRHLRISDISAAANISQVSIYNHFESKDALVRASLRMFYEQYVEEMERMVEEEPSFVTLVRRIIFIKEEATATYSFDRLYAWMIQDPEMKAVIDELARTRIQPLLMTIVHQARKNGEIHDQYPDELILFHLRSFQQQADELMALRRTYPNDEAFFEDIMGLFFYGLAGQAPEHQ